MKKTNDGRFYVYEHWRPDTGVCFYVGKGYRYRAYNLDAGRTKHHKNIAAKLRKLGMAIDVRIVGAGFTDSEACDFERLRIAYWKASGVRLINLTDGGEGPAGRIVTEETRRKLSAAAKKANARPDVQARVRAGLAKVKDQRIASLKATLSDPTIRQVRSLTAKRTWLDPVIRKRRSEGLVAAWLTRK